MTVQAPSTEASITQSGSVLFVDDDPRLLEAVKRRYRKEFDVRTVSSAAAALALLERDDPIAVVISDYHMPEMNGIAFLRRVRDVAPDVVRVLLTGSSDVRVATDAVNHGEVFRFLHKPCKEKELTAVLKVALDHYRLRQHEMERAASTGDDFTATVSHELQTPLASIRASAEILLACADIDVVTRQEILSTIAMEAEQLSQLIRQLLDTAEIAAGEVSLEIESIDLVDVIHAAAASVRDVCERFAVEIEMDIGAGKSELPGDSRRLIQVFGSLLGNAVRVAPRGSTINLAVRCDARRLEVRVADRGSGVVDEMKERIFERLVRRDEILTSKPQGAGLGLAIAKDVIEMHDGTIHCEDNPGGGAVFVVELPRGGVPRPQLSQSGPIPM